MHECRNTYSLSIANHKECAPNKIVKVHLISKLIQLIVKYAKNNIAQSVIINIIKVNAIKMALNF